MTSLPTAIPWYKSPQTIGLITTFIAAAVALFPKAGVLLGLTSPTAIQTAVSNVAGVVALIAPFIGTIVRAKSTVQPITLTQAQADAHPVTVAAVTHVVVPAAQVFEPMHAPTEPIEPPAPHPPAPVEPAAQPIPGKPWGKA